MYFVYILECQDKSLYTGITNNLKVRFQKHLIGKGAKYTASHRPKKIVHSERRKTLSAALKREREIKGWTRKGKLEFIRAKGRPVVVK